jgi:hypothetical protein
MSKVIGHRYSLNPVTLRVSTWLGLHADAARETSEFIT